MTFLKTLLIAVTVGLTASCSSTKKGMSSDATDETKAVTNMAEDAKKMEAGFMKGTVIASKEEGDCPFVIQVEAEETYFLDPINMDETFQKDGEKIWFTFSGLRMMNRCDKANPINLIEIEKRTE